MIQLGLLVLGIAMGLVVGAYLERLRWQPFAKEVMKHKDHYGLTEIETEEGEEDG